jgi:hypothetical protein
VLVGPALRHPLGPVPHDRHAQQVSTDNLLSTAPLPGATVASLQACSQHASTLKCRGKSMLATRGLTWCVPPVWCCLPAQAAHKPQVVEHHRKKRDCDRRLLQLHRRPRSAGCAYQQRQQPGQCHQDMQRHTASQQPAAAQGPYRGAGRTRLPAGASWSDERNVCAARAPWRTARMTASAASNDAHVLYSFALKMRPMLSVCSRCVQGAVLVLLNKAVC